MSALATGITLPLYLYPSNGAATWQPAFNAISSNSKIPWLAIVNPSNGPGSTGKPGNNDPNYITGTSKLNSYSNVKTIGYVYTSYAKMPLRKLKDTITTWSKWSTYSGANIAVHGIFFDECSTANFDYLNQAITFARGAFGNGITTVCNFGTKAGAKFYTICDVVVAFESCLNCPDGPPYMDQATLSNNIPSGYMTQGAIILNRFTGTSADGRVANQALINEYVQTMKQNGLGWFYFASAGYDSLTTLPATVGADAAALAA
ncbi:Spherulation-specific family 4-domain-containing protein [Dactylonectria macrodidyma]|uniref:Spherulation-specific family 4-domain-containing protein n=2 Tax=Dactylonectria TaxID=1620264 RepID=A0A9P9CXR0_9HYPO|nr:Spherulation-specific family 4-domain-containing protein [Dactylonectria macrodidyma]KAH7111681.1 Spherulation-specific family 4-domain-containing protein [Dactylonectria estremocensis]